VASSCAQAGMTVTSPGSWHYSEMRLPWEVGRVLRPGAPLVVSFSNRCFPTKAVAIWLASSVLDQQRLIGTYMRASGFTRVTQQASTSARGDPLWVVIGNV
jgi:hypothetical protein